MRNSILRHPNAVRSKNFAAKPCTVDKFYTRILTVFSVLLQLRVLSVLFLVWPTITVLNMVMIVLSSLVPPVLSIYTRCTMTQNPRHCTPYVAAISWEQTVRQAQGYSPSRQCLQRREFLISTQTQRNSTRYITTTFLFFVILLFWIYVLAVFFRFHRQCSPWLVCVLLT